MYIPINGQIICGCCGCLQYFDQNKGSIDINGHYHSTTCCKYKELKKDETT